MNHFSLRAKYKGKNINTTRTTNWKDRVELWVLQKTRNWYLLSEDNSDTLRSLLGSHGAVAINFARVGKTSTSLLHSIFLP